ncbi:IMPACT family protein [Pseudovibrio exalbescens]|uniref:Phosphoenolpyruvate carboxykinase n=1 Tax=Pseudovibrio exalbescens TaxID=197461 RepID=A0A1U7JJH8_9HYPH|nr:YigZ family protein [Pseudovibrio exalbescens]OKL44893.1 phosphoenolpyruvate carboxykinase [Pseudovibrio exalbescens]
MAFYTITQEFRADTEEKKSRFLAFLVPYDQFDARLAALREQHRKANHHVTAFRRMLDEGRVDEGAKDDGEPAGTSGMPMLKAMIGANLINCGVIVVRYFGGIKLGTGGLARAYAGAANAVISCADLEQWHPMKTKVISVGFAQSAEIERRISDLNLTVLDRTFTEDGAVLTVEGPEETIDAL